MEVLCRVDRVTMKYELDLELFTNIDLVESYYEFSSVGRIYINLQKAKKPERWRRLTKTTEKIPNMSLWWELHEKYEEELLDHTTFETDDKMSEFVHIESPKPKKKKNKGKKKKSSSNGDADDSFKSEEL
mmetsp:Transcript_25011/g.18869  ORF Transcript_25011/g.18869 Transcript_25011/m.18869 type:complete len:130 (-) Transcript_25011:30-419(-)|eukprot:CAMPEP_0202965554 /NCGR_PEP_ID=MMETSP1396-20130829/9489_1 /ASSEMBLY_ACC=CAM_ASM_000872 /TAXON_ID= /ORGANISM="Pseudokeronopsis sp., Strain Brazil" /LENGTH=129 /DNA_ID=CAMNT_0049688303 /DNA_START=525 /DNA_END=914 /DNA_ORIENTATION=-